MSANRTAWHPPFTGLLQERGPRWTKVTGEVQLTAEPMRADDMIELRAGTTRDPRDRGHVLRGMWRFVVVVALLEFKSISRPFRRGDLARLLAYGLLWYISHQREDAVEHAPGRRAAKADDLSLVLVVPALTPTLTSELRDLRLTLRRSKRGYHRAVGAWCTLVVIELRVAGRHEHDDLMLWFAGVGARRSLETYHWIGQHTNRGDPMSATPDLEGYDEWLAKFLPTLSPEQRLAGLKPEQIRQALSPEQRLAGLEPEQIRQALSPEHVVLALSDEALRALASSFIETLPNDVQKAIRARVGGPAPKSRRRTRS